MGASRKRLIFGVSVLGSALLAGVAVGRADIVIFKDGFVLSGKVGQGNETIVDPASGMSFRVWKGSYFVMDGARRITFSHQQAQAVEKKDPEADAEIVRFGTRVSRLNSFVMDPLLQVGEATPWNGRWERDVEIVTASGGQRHRYKVKQRLALLTPQFGRIDALMYNWSTYYMTNELGVEEVRKLLALHPDLREPKPESAVPKKKEGQHPPKTKTEHTAPKPKISDKEGAKPKAEAVPESAKRLLVARFFTQAGWYGEADKEYADILKRFPEEKVKVEAGREQLRGLRNLQHVEAAELANQCRQHARAQQLLATFPRKDVDEAVLGRVRALRARYESLNETLKQSSRLLKELSGRVSDQRWLEATAVMLSELNHDNANRLEAFLGLARQAERDREQKRQPEKTPEQLLALAVTGWLLGKDSAEPKPESALRLWDARRFVLDYLKTDDEDSRDRLLQEYQRKTAAALAVDEMAQLIPSLPPPLPGKNPTPLTPMELKARDLSGRRDGLSYWVQLPPEFRHGQSYPVVFALHQTRESPKAMLGRCAYQAALHGSILVAPGWGGEGGQPYSYSPEEHAAVLQVLWDLGRRFPVNRDRIFLLGVGEGAAMAYDVGLSHPDLFAGVLPVSGSPHLFAQRYAQAGGNAQQLPFYVVDGTQAGDLWKANHDLFERTWVPQGYPSLLVEYGGRGLEWFAAELPSMFEWMDHKKRASAFPSLGKREMLSMRRTDNWFYWISLDDIRPANLNDNRFWKNGVIPASIAAGITEGNHIGLTARGIRRLTVWLGRDSQGRDMIDFAKPITIRVNGAVVVNNRPVRPSLQTLLEDLYQRGDRQRLFFAKERVDLR